MNEHKAVSDFKFEDPFFYWSCESPRHRIKTCPHRKPKIIFAKMLSKSLLVACTDIFFLDGRPMHGELRD
jgi:hypothetical protein